MNLRSLQISIVATVFCVGLSLPANAGRRPEDMREIPLAIAIENVIAFADEAYCFNKEDSDFDFLRHYLPMAKISRHYNSPYSADISDDVHLSGNVRFSFGSLPDMQLGSLRLVYAPQPRFREYRQDHTPDWTLDPKDSARLIAHFKPLAKDTEYTSFHVSIDGEPAFKGEICEGPPEIISAQVGQLFSRSRLMFVDESKSPMLGARRDLPLQGNIEITLGDLAPLKLNSLLLVHSNFSYGFNYPDGYSPDWQIHPDDVAKILAYYEPIAAQAHKQQAQQKRTEQITYWLPVLTCIAAILSFTGLWFLYSKHRSKDPLASS